MENKDEKLREEARKAAREEREVEGRGVNDLISEGKNRKNNGTRRTNNLWLWLGVLILVFILLWWLWSIGIFEDISGVTNG